MTTWKREPMTEPSLLPAALRACAAGFYPFEAACELLIATGWPHRGDFAPFITAGVSISDGITPMAGIDWAGAISAVDTGLLPCSDLLTELLSVTAADRRDVRKIRITRPSPCCPSLIATETGHTALNQSATFSSLPLFGVCRSGPSALVQSP